MESKTIWLLVEENRDESNGYTAFESEEGAWAAAAKKTLNHPDLLEDDKDSIKKLIKKKDYREAVDLWSEILEEGACRTSYMSVERLTLNP